MRTDALTRTFRARLARLQAALLPWRCQLCGAPGQDGLDLCHACDADLPRNRSCCARCALPLPHAAELCGECQRRLPPWDAAWAPFRYGWPLDRLESRFKFGADLAAGRTLSKLWAREFTSLEKPDLILPVPLHPKRLRQRGYNQALELARPLAAAWHVPMRSDILQRERDTAAQTELDRAARRRNMRGAFSLSASIALPAHIALLDDVMTTGATLAECALRLKRAGVRRVDVWALARAPSR
ncbi:comF family protein [Dyella sp. OK004]|uniref:ComF family protein n=1 Tax=Dyella sp. OK004 TaxID=1855292 RepID=UPI0008E41FE8|nr:ComF family protein [Dyella sp. OK004]SFS16427.1 comF family protein [Dyella sp. OK004]